MASDTKDDKLDPLFNEVAQFAIENGELSGSNIITNFQMGYGRSARILEQLERNGVIGPKNGVKPREVLVASLNEIKPSQNIEAELNSLDATLRNEETQPLIRLLGQALLRMEKLHDNPDELLGIRTGYDSLDEKLSGLQKGNLIVLAARPGMGKSALAQNIMLNVATKENKSVIYFSLGMGKNQVTNRILSIHSEIEYDRLHYGQFKGDDFRKLSESIKELEHAPIYINDRSNLTIDELLAEARRVVEKMPKQNELGLIVVDCMQAMGNMSEKSIDRTGRTSEISRGLKLIARSLDVPVLALSQLSRSIESRRDKIPRFSDLRGPGLIEQDADVVMFIYRDNYYDEESERANIADLFVFKNHNGEQCKVELYFEPEILKFSS
jgi:replicative DNA helicase